MCLAQLPYLRIAPWVPCAVEDRVSIPYSDVVPGTQTTWPAPNSCFVPRFADAAANLSCPRLR